MPEVTTGGPVRGRFAPTPSGRMHLGNVFSALMAWLSVRSVGGTLVLRIEDLDPRAQRREVAELLMRDLEWLGLTWDEGPYFQSERTAIYRAAVDKLTAQGLTWLLHPRGAPCGKRAARIRRHLPLPGNLSQSERRGGVPAGGGASAGHAPQGSASQRPGRHHHLD